MKNSKQLQFIIPIAIIVIGLAWVGYQRLGRKSTTDIPTEPQTYGKESEKLEEKDFDDQKGDGIDGKSVSTDDVFSPREDVNDTEPIAVPIGYQGDIEELKKQPYIPSDGLIEEDKVVNGPDIASWNSFTNKAYNYTVKFPNNWYWDGTNVNVLVISAEPIKPQDQALTVNNLKIVKADQEVLETDVQIISLGEKFKAVYLKNRNHADIVKQIISSFETN
jgi:hypothetical protein